MKRSVTPILGLPVFYVRSRTRNRLKLNFTHVIQNHIEITCHIYVIRYVIRCSKKGLGFTQKKTVKYRFRYLQYVDTFYTR